MSFAPNCGHAIARRVPSTTYDITGNTYKVISNSAERTAMQVTFDRASSGTFLLLRMDIVVRPEQASRFYGAIRIGSNDYEMIRFPANSTHVGVRVPVSGARRVRGPEPGTYVVEPVFRCHNTGETLRFASGYDSISYEVQEL